MTCALCDHTNIVSGQDELLYEDSSCYIINNGHRGLMVGEIMIFAKQRVSLVLKDHRKEIDDLATKKYRKILTKFLENSLGIKPGNYFIQQTSKTFPDHYHTHAYIPPFTDITPPLKKL